MSVEKLKLEFDDGYFTIIKPLEDRFIIKIDVPCAAAVLDRGQAHLLMLYLQEHLEQNRNITEYEKHIYNAALELAARMCDDICEFGISEDIRKEKVK